MEKEQYKLDAIGRKPEGLMPVEGKFVNEDFVDKLKNIRTGFSARKNSMRKAKDAIESAQSILGVLKRR